MTRALRIFAAGAAVLGVLLAVAALREGRQQLAARESRDALVAEASGRDRDSQASRDRLERAIAAAPHDADLLELRARWALRDVALAKDPQVARAAAAVAVRDFRAALQQRPQWPYAWSGLATALDADGADAATVAQAADAALRFGGNERRVNAELADLMLVRRDPIPALGRAWTRALADLPEHWIDRADRAGRGMTACSGSALPDKARARCVALGWLPEPAPRG